MENSANYFGPTRYLDLKEFSPIAHWLSVHGLSEDCSEELYSRLIEPHRFYHGMFHILRLWEIFKKNMTNRTDYENTIIGFSIAFHDSVYEIGSDQNEENSNLLFLRMNQDNKLLTKDQFSAISSCILHSKPSLYSEIKPYTIEHKFVVDYDLEHLKNPDKQWNLISELIFKEYQRFNYEMFYAETKKLLESIPFPEVKSSIKRLITELNPEFSNKEFVRKDIGLYFDNFSKIHSGHGSILRQSEMLFDKVIIFCSTQEFESVRKSFPYHEIRIKSEVTEKNFSNLYKIARLSLVLNETDKNSDSIRSFIRAITNRNMCSVSLRPSDDLFPSGISEYIEEFSSLERDLSLNKEELYASLKKEYVRKYHFCI